METPSEEASTHLEMDFGIIEEENDMQNENSEEFIVQSDYRREQACCVGAYPMAPQELRFEDAVLVSTSINPEAAWEELRTNGNLKLPTIILSIFTDEEDAFFDDDVKHALEEGLAKKFHEHLKTVETQKMSLLAAAKKPPKHDTIEEIPSMRVKDPNVKIYNIIANKTQEKKCIEVINYATDMWLLISPKETAVSELAVRTFVKTCDRDNLNRSACIGIFSSPEEKGSFSDNVMIFEKKRKSLEDRYTHILRLGADCKFHPALEELLASLETGEEGRRSSTPVVSILVHGGVEACKKLKEDMEGYPSIPVVIVKGSGGLADVIVDALAAYNKLRKRGRLLHSHIENFLGQSSLAGNLIVVDHVENLVEKYSNSMIVYDHKRDPYGLHRAVFESCKVLSGQTPSIVKGMKLAICIGDITKFKNDIIRSDPWVRRSLFYFAIKNEKADFVRFLLSKNENLEAFVESKFHTLCQKKFEDLNTVFQKLMKKELEKEEKNANNKENGQDKEKKYAKKKMNTSNEKLGEPIDLQAIGDEDATKLVERPASPYAKNGTKKSEEKTGFKLEYFDTLLEDLLDRDFVRCFGKEGSQGELLTATQKMIFWSIFNNMPKLVNCFWEHESDKAVENAVIIFRVAKSLSHYTVLSASARKSFKSLAEEYEKRAVDVLTCYYQSDTEASVDIVKRRIPLWGNKSILTIAANSGSREIVSHSSCQEYLTNVWNGKIYKKQTKENDENEDDKSEENDQEGREEEEEDKKQTWFNFFGFLFRVPKGKLFLHEFMFTIFLGCFSFIVLVKKGKYHDPLRFTVFTIVTALAIDEIREVLEIRKDNMRLKLKEWMKSVWNRLDVIALILFYIAFAFGFYDHRTAERSMMAVDLVLWVIKFAQFYRMFYSLGPYLIMIYKMIFHMAGFFLVLVIAVIAYGIFMHTLLFPDVTVSWKILFQVLFRPYLLAFGELGVEKHDLSKGKTIYGTPKISESTEIIVVIGMCLYLLLANVLLINMLIAVFNNIYEDIKENSDKIWRFDKYDLIMEFERKPTAPIPFSIIPNIIRIFRAIRALIKSNTAEERARDTTRCQCSRFCICCKHMCKKMLPCQSKVEEPSNTDEDLQDFQSKCMWDYLRESSQRASLSEDVASIVKRSDHLSNDMIEFNERLDNCFEILMRLDRGNGGGE